jgi:hypothetical protein
MKITRVEREEFNMTRDELMRALAFLPADENTPTGIPQPLAAYLSNPRRIAQVRLSLPWIEYRLLAGLALSGWSLRYELIQAEAAYHDQDPRNGTFNRASTHLEQVGLWQVATVRLATSVALVRLTELGQRLLTEIGLAPVTSEWDRMETQHRGGDRQLQHTAAACLFAFHARIRGYRVTLCPKVDGQAEPDLMIEKMGKSTFVEVQGRGGEAWRRAAKWHSAYRLQGEAAICALTPAQAVRYAREAQRAGVPCGRVTDLHTLYRDEPVGLWTHTWRSRSGRLLPVVADERVGHREDRTAFSAVLSI